MDSSSLKKSRISRQIEEAKERHRSELYDRRIEGARQAFQDMKAGRFKEAVQGFNTYIRILEEGKKVSPGELEPSLFDTTKEATELLLICGVFWDLAKIYDRSKGGKKTAEMNHYLQKWLIFSRKMPHQKISIDTIQKYLATGQAFHRGEFTRAYQTLSQSKCFIATSLMGEISPEEVFSLRVLRDSKFKQHPLGRRFIAFYYRRSPAVSEVLSVSPKWIRKSAATLVRVFYGFFS